jgi:hypothetical protein
MNARGRFGFGVVFVAVGVAVWTRLLWAYEPVGRSSAHIPSQLGGQVDVSVWLTGGRDLRLAALILGVGGLLIPARGWRPGVWLALVLGVAWAGADFGLDVADVKSLAPVVVAGLAVATAAVAIIVASARRNSTTSAGRAWWLLVYAGMAVGVTNPLNNFDGSDTPPWHLLIFAAMVASALVAGAAVNPGGTSTTGWRMAAVLVALAVALYLLWYFGWNRASRSLEISTVWWHEAVWAAAVLLLSLVAAAAIATTGALSGRRGALAVPAVALALVPAAMARTVPPLPWLAPLVGSGVPFDATDGRRYLPGQLIAGLVLGVSAWVLARLAPVLFGPAVKNPAVKNPAVKNPAVKNADAPRPTGTRRWTTAVGLLLAAAGVVSWAVAVAVVAPAARAVGHGPPVGIHITAPLIGWAANLRWGAILLAWGGLLLAARTRDRARWLAAGVLVWFAADLAIAVVGPRGWLAAGICAVVAGVALWVMALTSTTVAVASPGSVIYAAAAAGAGIEMMAIKAWMPQYLPSWAFQLGLAVSLLLVVAAAVHTLTADLTVRAGQVVGAVVLATAGIAGAVLHYVIARHETDRGSEVWMLLTLVAAVAVAATAGALSSARTIGVWGATGAVVLVVIGTLPLFWASLMLAYLPQDLAFALDGLAGLSGEWFDDTLAGAALGVSVALVALLPKALSTPDSPLATDAPPPPEPPSPPGRPAPEAVPGVPEVLSWPSDPDAVPVG